MRECSNFNFYMRLSSFVVFVVHSLSHVQLFVTLWSAALQASLPFTTPGACSNSYPLSWRGHVTILPSVSPSHPAFNITQYESFLMSKHFASGSQSIGAIASASVLPMSIKDWFPLGLMGMSSLQSKGLSRVFSNTTVQKHQFFGVQSSLWSNSHIPIWLLEKTELRIDGTLMVK